MCDICNELEQARFLTESRGFARKPSDLVAVLPLEEQLATYKQALEVAAERIIKKDDLIELQLALIGKQNATIAELQDYVESLTGGYSGAPTVSGPAEFDFTADPDDYEVIQDYWESLGYGTRGE